jgi:hypothetical protein
MSGAAAVMAMSIASVGAQTPQQPPTQPPTTQTPTTQTPAPATAAQATATTTIQGCVYKEQDIPGRSPNVAEKAGVMEDYILVASANASGATAGTSGTTGTAGTTGGTMAGTKAYKLEKVADEQLRAVVGKRVEVTGRVDAERGDTATGTATTPARDANVGPDKIELPEFEVTSMKEVAGTCPAAPAIRK